MWTDADRGGFERSPRLSNPLALLRLSTREQEKASLVPSQGPVIMQVPSLLPQRMRMMTPMPDTQRFQFHESLPHTTEPETQDIKANEEPPVKRLDGEVTKRGEEDIPFSGGTYCEVWVGLWEKRSGEKVEAEKVSLSLVISILLIALSVGGLESTPNGHVARDGAYGSAFPNCLYAAYSCSSPRSIETRI